MFDESYKLMKTFEFQTTKEGVNELMKNVPEGSTIIIEAGIILEWITGTPSIYGGGKQTDLNMAHMDNGT